MANEIQRITFPGWLGVGGSIVLSLDTTGLTPGGGEWEFGYAATWDGVDPDYFATEVWLACWSYMGQEAVNCSVYQYTEPVILQFDFQNTTYPLSSPDLRHTNVNQLVVESYTGPNAPTVATIQDGDPSLVFVGSGGVRAGGIGTRLGRYVVGSEGGVVAGGASVLKFRPFISGGNAIGGDVGLGLKPAISGGARTGGIGDRILEAIVSTSGGAKINGFPYLYKHEVTIPAGKVAADLEGYPLPVRIQADPTKVTSNLIFTDASDNVLRHQLLNIVGGKVYAYVKTPIAANSDTVVRMYF